MFETTVASGDVERYKAYDRLNAVADILMVCAVILLSYFLPSSIASHIVVYGLVLFMAVFSVLWHAVVPDRFLGPRKLLIKNVVDGVLATLIIQYTGQEQSPFVFLYYLVLLAAAVSIGVRYTFLLAGFITVAYVVISGIAIQRLVLEPTAFIYIWADIISLWLVAYLAAFLADETAKARKGVAEAREKFESFSKIDWLTGLYNMKHFDVLGVQEVARAERYGHPLAMLMVDSDFLKAINDTYGHQKGDQLIVNLATTVSQNVRASDTVIRYGGDEFLVVLPETDSLACGFLAERIRAAVEEQGLQVGQTRVKTTVSIGMTCYPKDAPDPMGLLARADAALRHSKQMGRNRVSSYIEGMELQREVAPRQLAATADGAGAL
jgi:diguanylate cyclase (GGDEF)-like protein